MQNQTINQKNNEVKLQLKPTWSMYFIDTLFLWIVTGVLIVLAGADERAVAQGSMCMAAFIVLVLLYRAWYMTSVKWTVTDKQIRSEHGVFMRDVNYIELYRVVDYAEKQSFLQLIFGVKDVIIYSGDRTDPALRIYGIPNGMPVIPVIKPLVEQQKKENYVYEITNR